MKIVALLSLQLFFLRQLYAFHVDSSPELARKTFLKRVEEPDHIRHGDMQQAYTDKDRQWRFPDPSLMRPIGETALPSLTDQDRLWHFPTSNVVRHTSSLGSYTDQDRMWGMPRSELMRHDDSFPPTLKDDERLWWKGEDFEHLLREDDDEDSVDWSREVFHSFSSATQSDKMENLFRRPGARFSRHPHSVGKFDDEVVSTMLEDDVLGWLTENTNTILSDDMGDDFMGTC
jgi:hypothetical protein